MSSFLETKNDELQKPKKPTETYRNLRLSLFFLLLVRSNRRLWLVSGFLGFQKPGNLETDGNEWKPGNFCLFADAT